MQVGVIFVGPKGATKSLQLTVYIHDNRTDSVLDCGRSVLDQAAFTLCGFVGVGAYPTVKSDARHIRN